jgi:hypothetical protein
MKACKQRTDVTGLLASGSGIDPGRVKRREIHTTPLARERVQSSSPLAITSRDDRIRALKEQVDAGTYVIDNHALAKRIQVLVFSAVVSTCNAGRGHESRGR